jgi:hypothetical protein
MDSSVLDKLLEEGKVKIVKPKEKDYNSLTISDWLKLLKRNSLEFEKHFNKFNELDQDQWYEVLKVIPKFIKQYNEQTEINDELTNTNVVVSFFPNTMFWLL